MDAIYTYWSLPSGQDHRARWATTLDHLLSWTLAVGLSRRWFDRLVLYTDTKGARLLADRLRLPFDEVHCTLDSIAPGLDRWWALGKLYSYRAHPRPFVHLDSDVFLWRPLRHELLTSPVFTQNPERFPFHDSYYAPLEIVRTVRDRGGWLAPELEWYLAAEGNEACCCGVVGGSRVDFIGAYASSAIALIERNRGVWDLLPQAIEPNVVVEQYFLSAFYYFHARTRRYRDVEMRYLFETESAAYDETNTSSAGFTHLIADAKHHPAVLEKLTRRVRRDFPAAYERAMKVSTTVTA